MFITKCRRLREENKAVHNPWADQEVERAFEVFQSYGHINFCNQISSHTGGTGSRQGCMAYELRAHLGEVELVEGLCLSCSLEHPQ